MSRTDAPSRIKSPVKRYISFSGGDGQWSYWDATASQEVEFDDLEFILVETRSSVTGWNDELGGRITSNLTGSTKDTLKIRCKNKEIYSGTYADGKAEINGLGGKFTTNLFGLARLDGKLTSVCVQLSGAALAAWMKFVEENSMRKIYEGGVMAVKGDQQKKGAVKYYVPNFQLVSAEKEDLEAADKFSVTELAPYLGQ
jgi:hypothetical protein